MNLYWDYQNLKLIGGLLNPRPITSQTWILRDQLPISLFPVVLNGASYVSASNPGIPVGYAVKFSAKLPSALDAPATLLYAYDWTYVPGDFTTAVHFDATMYLDNNELITAIDTDNSILLKAEFVLNKTLDSSNTDSTQFDLTVLKDVNQSAELPTSPAAPVPFQWFVDVDGQSKVRIVNALGQPCGVFSPL